MSAAKSAAALAHDHLTRLLGGRAPTDIWVCGFRHFPGSWTGGRGPDTLRGLDPDAGNFFFCIGDIAPGEPRRSSDGVVRQQLLIVDDIGTKVDVREWEARFAAGCPRPTLEIETSPGNATWLWRLERPIERVEADAADWAGLALIRAWLAEWGLTDDVMDTARYVRLPMGWNSKPKYAVEGDEGGPRWPSVSATGGTGESVTLDELGQALLGGAGWRDKAPPEGAPEASVSGGVGGALRRTASMTDPLVMLADELGLLPQVTRGGVIEALCPNMANHGDRPETGFAFLGGNLCQCMHASCQGLRSADFRAMMVEQYTGRMDVQEALGVPIAEGTPRTGEGFLAHADMAGHGALGGAGDEALGDEIDAVARSTAARTATKIADKDAALAYLCQRFVFVSTLNAFFDTEDRLLLSAEQFDRHRAVTAWLPVGASGPRRATNVILNRPDMQDVAGLTYIPGEGAMVDAEGENGAILPHANTWLPSRVGTRSGVPSRWLELVEHVVPEPTYRAWMLDWLAWVLQNPAARASTVPLIVGGQGIGKDMMLAPIVEILGRHNAKSVSVKMLESSFNGWMKSRLAILSELKVSVGSRLYEQLKEWTGLQNRVSVNEKFVKPYTFESRLMFFAFSNHTDALEGLEADDRRWAIYISQAGKKPGAWYADMAKDLASADELERVHGWLMSRDLTNFNPFEKAPDVGGHHRVAMAASLPTAAGWVCEQVCPGGMFGDREWLTIQELLDAARVSGDQTVSRTITPRGVASGLMAAGCTNYGQVRVGGERQRVWGGVRVGPAELVRRQKFSPAAIRDAYEQERRAWAEGEAAKLLPKDEGRDAA